MTIGRIGGPMLKENLIRQGVDLSFETDLLYLDVNNLRIGVNTATPNVALDVVGTARFNSNLQINGSNIATYAGNGNITLSPNGSGKVIVSYLTSTRIPYAGSSGSIEDSSALTFDGANLVVGGGVKQTSISAPSSPSSDSMLMYVTASGVSPNREVAWKIKNQAGDEIIISSILV